MNGDVTRYESDHLKATAGYGVRKRNIQLVFFDGKFPRRAHADGLTVGEQTVDALERVETAVVRAGVEMDDVLRTTVYTTDADRVDDIKAAYDRYFEERRPAMTVVGVADLPGDAAVQIEATAVER
jgi:2-iminobutanoate/2-iminopropanoate deaminase